MYCISQLLVYPPKNKYKSKPNVVYQLINHVIVIQPSQAHCSSLQNTLGANNIARTNLALHTTRSSSPNGNSQGLERTLRAVVVIVTVGAANMQRDIGRLRKALQTVGDHLGAQVTDLLALEAEVDHSPGTAGEIDDSPGQGLVEGRIAAAKAGERLAGAERFCEGGAEGEEGVFRRVVVVN